MRHFLLFLLGCLTYLPGHSASHAFHIRGTVIDAANLPVPYATVALFRDSIQTAGSITDSLGHFVLEAAPGKYAIKIKHISFKALEQTVTVTGEDLGVFCLEDLDLPLKEVVITSHTITRKADRFVVSIGNFPAMAGKDGTELLSQAPGVWLDDSGVSINGAKGAKVYINGRELKLTQEQLISYLRSLTSADISRIEIIPQAGAEHAADARGGIILITLRKQLQNGVSGSLQFSTSQSKLLSNHAPSLNISALAGKWSINASAQGLFSPKGKSEYTEARKYAMPATEFDGITGTDAETRYGLGRIGAIYDINKQHSLGAEVEYSTANGERPSNAHTYMNDRLNEMSSQSHYDQHSTDNNLSVTLNYTWKTDTLGSFLKVLADYTREQTDGRNLYRTTYTTGNETMDTSYRNTSSAYYNIITTDIAWEKQIKPDVVLKTGIKYTWNRMDNHSQYESFTDAGWHTLPAYNYVLDYSENIPAAYASLSYGFKRWSFSAGLRGEYTNTSRKGNDMHKSYFSLFPNTSVSYSFNNLKTWMLIAQYSRNIERPGFLSLDPNRIQFSDYSYQIGNPALRPTYIHRVMLTLVFKYRYTLTIGGNLHRDLIREVNKTDPQNPNITYITPENHYAENHYFVAISSPFRFTNWWELSANLVGVMQDIRPEKGTSLERHYLFFANATTGFTLPAGFYLEIGYNGHNRLFSANSSVAPRHILNASFKKKMLDDKLILSIAVRNFTGASNAYGSDTPLFSRTIQVQSGWSARYYRIGITYTFRAGNDFKKRSVESGAQIERKRLERLQDH